jgi:hypothetical protein
MFLSTEDVKTDVTAVVRVAAPAFVWLACQWDASAYSYVEASVELHIYVFVFY